MLHKGRGHHGYCGRVTTGTGPGSCGGLEDLMFDSLLKDLTDGVTLGYCGHVCPGVLVRWGHTGDCESVTPAELWDICHWRLLKVNLRCGVTLEKMVDSDSRWLQRLSGNM